jgi:hypothetical protein
MPQGTAAARVDLTDHNKNKSQSVAGGQVVTLILAFDTGKTFVPEDLWDALISKYGAGKLIADTDVQAGAAYRWRVIP